MKYILNEHSVPAFNYCANMDRMSWHEHAPSFCVYAYVPSTAYREMHPEAGLRYAYSTPFHVGNTDDHVPLPVYRGRQSIRIRVTPKQPLTLP